MTGQTGNKSTSLVAEQEPLQRRGSVYALMQRQMIAAAASSAATAVSPAATQGGKRASMAVSGAEASQGKDVDPFRSKTIGNNSSDSSDDDDDDDDSDDDDDGPEMPWRYASFAMPGEPIAAAASAHVALLPPETHGEFVTLAVPLCSREMAHETVSGGLDELMLKQV
jgi:hypothetical protein